MSTPVGVEANFVDTQGIQLENKTDGFIYQQSVVINAIDIFHAVKFHQLTNDNTEKLFSLTDAKITATMLVTIPEFAALFNLSLQTAAQSPQKEWRVTMTDQSANPATLEGFASISQFEVLDDGVGLTRIRITLDFVSDTVGVGA